MRRLLVVLVTSGLAGCGPPPPATRPAAAPPATPPAAACDGRELRVVLPEAGPGDGTAALRVKRSGPAMEVAARATCVRVGRREVRVAPGEVRDFTIGAHPRRLQRLVIGGAPLLVHVTPRTRLSLRDNPCFFWELVNGAQRTPWSAAPPYAYCAAPREPGCRPGFRRAAPPRLAEDPLCPYGDDDAIRRCVAVGVVRLVLGGGPRTAAPAAAAGGTPGPPPGPLPEGADPLPLAALADGRRLEIYPRDCGFARVATPREVVGLAIGVGDRWLLRLDAGGRLQGEVE